MSEQVKKPIKITETILRDAHQSLIATRMPTDFMLPILEKMDKVGYHSVECWGGATFDASLRFLKEDPWDRLRKIRDGFKNTKLQMLFRGQNILGYRPYADDVVEYFVQKSISNGIDIIRIFDCLNDLRNLQATVDATNKFKAQEGRGHAQIALSYTLGDAYTLEYWADMAKKIEEMGADSICIKDMAGLLVPYKATELVTAMKSQTKLPIQLHTHYTSGVASMTYLKAVEAGVDVIDTAMSPFALGTSQPATEVMVETFKGTEYDTGFDQNLLAEIADYFRPYRDECLASGLLNPKVMGVDIKTLLYQVPGGMLSNMVSQLKEQNAEDRYYDVLREIPEVRKDLGEPPLVTPSSQIVGTQAVFNVLLGERYKMATKETKAVLRGEYGQTVKPMNQEVIDKVIPLGTSQPATEVMVETFKGTEYDTGFDQNLLAEIADYFRPYRDECLASGLLNPKVMGVDIKTLLYQVPGGMLSNMVSQLKEQNAEDRYYDVLREIPEVRKDLGEPPLVTPSSQIVGTQAVFNVLLGERYKMATKETKAVLRGEYGQTVKPMNQEVIDKVIPGEERITCRFADTIPNELDKLESEMKEWKQQDEDVLSYALFPQVATDYFKYRQAQQEKVDMTVADGKNGAYPV